MYHHLCCRNGKHMISTMRWGVFVETESTIRLSSIHLTLPEASAMARTFMQENPNKSINYFVMQIHVIKEHRKVDNE